MAETAACFLGLTSTRSIHIPLISVKFTPGMQLMTVLPKASSSLPQSILDKLRFRLDKATAVSTHLTKGTFQWRMCCFQLQIRIPGTNLGTPSDNHPRLETQKWHMITLRQIGKITGKIVPRESKGNLLVMTLMRMLCWNTARSSAKTIWLRMRRTDVQSAYVNSTESLSGRIALFYPVANMLCVPAASAP